jgi:hypothetical protein
MRRFGSRLAVLALWSGCAVAGEEGPTTVLERLDQAGQVVCEPAMPVFCANIHVTCSGPSTVRAFGFALRARSGQGSIASVSDTAGITQQYADARVEWEPDAASVILRPRQAGGYIKLLADGTYSFRHYASPEAAMMSRGHCR